MSWWSPWQTLGDGVIDASQKLLATGYRMLRVTVHGDPSIVPGGLVIMTPGGPVEVKFEIPKQPKQLRSCECCKCTCCHGDNPERGRAGDPVPYDDCWDKSG